MSLIKSFIELLQGVPPELATIILAATPVIELRGALPVAVLIYQLPLWLAVVLSVIGNMLPAYFLLVFFERGSAFLSARSPWWRRFFERLYARTRGTLETRVEKYGPWALALFVALPLPASGAWTGASAAFVFGLDKQKAFLAILLGVVIASGIVALFTVGASYTVRALIL